MLIYDQIKQWEDLILPFIKTTNVGGSISIPKKIFADLWLKQEVMKDDSISESVVSSSEFSTSLFQHGYISNLILLYAIAGAKYDATRRDLTKLLLNFTVSSHMPILADCLWTTTLFEKGVNIQILASLMHIWSGIPNGEKPKDYYQNFIPLFLLLGDYKSLPAKRKQLDIAYQALITGTCRIESQSWRDVTLDASIGNRMFQMAVAEANKIFSAPDQRIKIGKRIISITPDTNPDISDKLQEACNWMSFSAYITLLSKYARYSLSFGDCDTRNTIIEERTKMLGYIQTALK